MWRWIAAGALTMNTAPARAAGMMAPAALQARVEAFAGRPALVDPRLLLPDCAAPDLAWQGHSELRGSVMVHCASPEWRVFVPVEAPVPPMAAPSPAGPPPGSPIIRRGDRVMVEAGGAGFVVAMETIAEADARDGRVLLRAAGSGKRLSGRIGADGRIRINGLNAVVYGR